MASRIEESILERLSTADELHTEQLASELKITRHTASKYLEILRAKGIVDYRKVGNAKLWSKQQVERISHSWTPSLVRHADAGGGVGIAEMRNSTLSEHSNFSEIHPPMTAREAIVEAERCLQCGSLYEQAPCITACPANIDVPWFIREIKEGRPVDAARTIFAENVLGGSCSRVCPVEELCEGMCVLEKEGRRAIEIGRLQRYATDWALDRGISVMPEGSSKSHRSEEKIAVIGAGPASLACAAMLAELGYRPEIYEKRTMPGGLVTYGIAPYKQQFKPMPRETEEIEKLGVEFHYGVSIGEDLSIDELERTHDAIFLGIGLGPDVAIGELDRPLRGVYRSLEFIEELKLGEEADLQRVLGNRVAIIGGGNTAIDVAREAIRLGVGEVILIYRRTRDAMPAYRHEVEAAIREGVRCMWLTAPQRLIGEKRLEGIECISLRMADPDDGRRSKLEAIPGTETVLGVDSAILAIGQEKLTNFLNKIRGIELNNGLVKVDEYGRTTAQKFFAGGDCVNGGDTVVEAVAAGKRAAQGIDRYLTGDYS